MKILFLGDSITDMGRDRNADGMAWSYGVGYTHFIAGKLLEEDPLEYTVVNRGIGGDRIVDLYARVKADVWNEHPDVLSILVGVNDIWHEIDNANGVEIERFERIYDMLLSDTLQHCPNLRLILCEPFVLADGSATKDHVKEFAEIAEYAAVIKKLSEKFGAHFLPLQSVLEKAAAKYGTQYILYDGVHPNTTGAALIAREWLKLFRKVIL